MNPILLNSIIIAIVVIIGGYFALNKYQENKLVKEAQKEAKLFVIRNYEDIQEVTINKENYKFYPAALGGLSITGYVNGDKKLFFSVDFETGNNQIGEVTSFLNPKDFPPEKEACKDDFCQ